MFSSGQTNTCFAVAKVFESLGHDVVFIHRQENADWWDDTLEFKKNAPKCYFLESYIVKEQPLDLLIEVAFNTTPNERPRLCKTCVWYCRKPILFSDLEFSVYAARPEGRNLEGVHAIWIADLYNNEDDIQYIKTLYPSIAVEVVPWIWTPDIIESHRQTTQSPVWSQVYDLVSKQTEWTIHVSETNMSNSSSCTLPMVITRYAQLKKKLPVSRVVIHNSDFIKTNKFFTENVVKHCNVPDISFNFIGRQRVIDWVHEPHSLILSHSRFIPLKMFNLEAAWVGIPVIHNNVALRDLGNGLDQLYYDGNSVRGAQTALHKVLFDLSGVSYCKHTEGLIELRKAILTKYHPQSQINGWGAALERLLTRSPMPIETPSKVIQLLPVRSVIPTVNSEFTVLFMNMWDQFNETYNMFLLALDTALRQQNVVVRGYSKSSLPTDVKPDLVIFGPFGDDWKSLPESWPKVHFTAENSPPSKDPSVKLNIGYMLPDISDNSYLRMPLWMFEIDWFGANMVKIQNPLPLPIDSCTQSSADTYDSRSKFCSFIVTNPKNPVRNQAFVTLNQYKQVDSAGRLFNNVGDVIFAGLGGGGGELKKHEFLKKYRFCLAYENESASGYTTEKILHAKAAGCIPIYWGDPKVSRDFDSKGFLNANNCKTPEDLLLLVQAVESSPEAWKKIATTPALSSYSRDLVRRNFAEMVKRFVTIADRKELVAKLPPFLGATTTQEALLLQKKREGDVAPYLVRLEEPVAAAVAAPVVAPVVAPLPLKNTLLNTIFCVTGASQRFWPSLLLWLQSVNRHRLSIPTLQARVYVSADVSESALQLTSEAYKDVVEFVRFPTDVPDAFPDYWEPQHFAWKLWVCKTIVNDPTFAGKLILYSDAGTVTLRWPHQWLNKANETGVCVLEDSRQTNEQWCHADFCKALNVTDKEKKEQQIWAGSLAFVAGHTAARRLFDESYEWSTQRSVIVGEKWSGMLPDGRPYGHRHDQSILSILSSRLSIARLPLDSVYADKSARDTFHSGQSIYVHRGQYKTHQPIVDGIDDCYVINLDRRSDRLKNFIAHHPSLKGALRRIPAFDGKKLKLTPSLTRMFKPNDFFWKKAVMGCALSHMRVWANLIGEPSEIQSYLILEDDARLDPKWIDAWRLAYPHLPDGWDCVYLGGILPPNRAGFINTLERVGPGLARVAPNQHFGQPNPTRYFHFCAYAYVLSRSGAAKILESILDHDGYWTSADHMICNPVDKMNLYVLDPMVAGASQDDDPIYQKAEFNNFSRIDNFDSDLWNNDERFTSEEIQAQMNLNVPLHISATFSELDAVMKGLPIVMPKQDEPEIKEIKEEFVSQHLRDAGAVTNAPAPAPSSVPAPVAVKRVGPRFVALDSVGLKNETLYESNWLQDLFQKITFSIESVKISDPLEDDTDIIAVVIKTKWAEQIAWLNMLRSRGKTFKILHLSDEFLNDPIHFYAWPEVSRVLRFYDRTDIPQVVREKVLILPLGYHRKFKGGIDSPFIVTPELPFRDFTWSFAGTNWQGRKESMQVLNAVNPSFVRFFDDWNSPQQMKEEEYISLLLSSKFVVCPRGQNQESYRFYEAITCGCIPLFLTDEKDSIWLQQFEGSIPFITIQSWEHAAALMQHLTSNPPVMEQYRKAILHTWSQFIQRLKEKVANHIKN
jgi:GR25 family glycosyltransferase involved in LPS biosynthesis